MHNVFKYSKGLLLFNQSLAGLGILLFYESKRDVCKTYK